MAFWIPTKPYTLKEAILRMRVATGDVPTAQACASADFNGHRLSLTWNEYRQYYVGSYIWSGQQVLTRSANLQDALAAMLTAYDVGGKGTCLIVVPRSDRVEILGQGNVLFTTRETPCQEDWAFAAAHPRLRPHSKKIMEAAHAQWQNWQFSRVGEALLWERQLGAPLQLFLDATSAKEWDAARNKFFEDRRAGQLQRRP